MIAPPLFKICAASPAVKQALGTAPVRLFAFGQAPQNTPHPYGVWQIIAGSPYNYLADRPEVDAYTVQIDVYGKDGATARAAATAIRDAIELTADVTRWGGETVDPTTKNYRISFDTSWNTRRNP